MMVGGHFPVHINILVLRVALESVICINPVIESHAIFLHIVLNSVDPSPVALFSTNNPLSAHLIFASHELIRQMEIRAILWA